MLTPVPFTPGAPPTLPGFYLHHDAPPLDVLAMIDAGLREPPPVIDLRPRARSVRIALTALLLGVSAGASTIDARLGFPYAAFGILTAFCWLGIVLVFIATSQPRRLSDRANAAVGCLSFAALIPAVILLFGLVSGRPLGRSAIGWFEISVFFVLLGWSRDFQAGAPAAPVKAPDLQPVHEIREVIEALTDDLAPGRRLLGWIDLSGPVQPGKLCRQGKARNGARICLYQDEWWRLVAPLADGNELRISAVERRKVRGAFWKMGRRRKKRKPAKETGLAHLELRLSVDPRRVRLKPEAQVTRVGDVTLLPAQTRDGKLLTAQCELPLFSAQAVSSREVLGVLAAFYKQLERVPA